MKFLLPSPLQQIELPLFQERSVEVWVKRDDLIHPLVSGNKWRKLKYLLERATTEEKSHLVTFGGAFSNHLLATAAAAQAHGLKASAFVRGEPVDNPVLQACKNFGMQLRFTNRLSYRDKKGLFRDYFGADDQAFFVDEGGASEAAVQGCAELIAELPQTFDHIFCAAGTGTTAAGLFSGISKQHLKTQLHVVPVLKDGLFLSTAIEKYMATNERLHFHTGYHFGGYARINLELLQFIIGWQKDTGILTDPVYTGKLVFGLMELIRNNSFEQGSKILWIHTGGLSGLCGYKERFEALDPDFTQKFIPESLK